MVLTEQTLAAVGQCCPLVSISSHCRQELLGPTEQIYYSLILKLALDTDFTHNSMWLKIKKVNK